MRNQLHDRAEVFMFEQYGLYHYSFSEDDTRPIEKIAQMEFMEEDLQSLDAILRADYHLSGYVDVLPALPQPEDSWRSHMFLQSFSVMRSGAGYYTVREGAESYLLICTLSGSGSLTYEGHVYALERGSAVWLDCRKHHDYRTASGSWEHIDVHTDGTGIRRLYEEYTKQDSGLTVYPDTGAIMILMEHILQAYTVPSVLRSMRIAHALESLFVMLNEARYPQTEEQHTERAAEELLELVRYMNTHFREPLTMDELSQRAGISKYHLSREFKKLTGFPPNEYMIRLRLEHAKLNLINTQMPVHTIAEISGIPNEAYFSRLFHRRFGMTPNAWRRKMNTGS